MVTFLVHCSKFKYFCCLVALFRAFIGNLERQVIELLVLSARNMQAQERIVDLAHSFLGLLDFLSFMLYIIDFVIYTIFLWII